MRVTLLGTGSAHATARRASAGTAIEWSGGWALLDASAGTWMRALKAGLAPERMRALFLSHFHPDHTGDLPGLLFARRNTPGLDAPLLLVGPPGTDRLLAAVRALYAGWGDWLDTPVEVAGYPFEGGGVRVDAFPTDHAPGAVCLRVTADGRTLGYSGDSGDTPGLRRALEGADCALLECTVAEPAPGHLSPEECRAVIAATRPARALLTHLGPGVETSLPCGSDGQTIRL